MFSTSTLWTMISSPNHRCSDLVIVNSVAAARISLFGSKSRSRNPQPNSGNMTRSPGEVMSACRTLARMLSLPVSAVTWPSSLIRNGKPKLVVSISFAKGDCRLIADRGILHRAERWRSAIPSPDSFLS